MGRLKDPDNERELDYDNYVEYPECQLVFGWHADDDKETTNEV
tara:strand:+ start:876 stop:1004 length:129 start_codon:yes stop_codon:yes gene_type:complete